MLSILRTIFKTSLKVERIRQKHVLRERLIQYVPQRTGRTEELAQNFRENPEFYFPHLPIDAVLGVQDGAIKTDKYWWEHHRDRHPYF